MGLRVQGKKINQMVTIPLLSPPAHCDTKRLEHYYAIL